MKLRAAQHNVTPPSLVYTLSDLTSIMNDDEVNRGETLYDETVAHGKFLWSVTFFITSGQKPGVGRIVEWNTDEPPASTTS